MSVPTIFAAVSGKAISITSPKSVPLPTDVRPTTKPPTMPVATAIARSRFARMNGLSSGLEWRYALIEEADPAEDERDAEDRLRGVLVAVAVLALEPPRERDAEERERRRADAASTPRAARGRGRAGDAGRRRTT